MITKSVIRSTLLALSMFAALPVFAASGDPTIHQVYEAADAGRFSDAQAMMDKVLRDNPNSAKAHFVEAELLAKQARLHDAEVELTTAERLDPTEKFVTNRKTLQELQARISGSHTAVQRVQPAYAQPVVVNRESNSGSGWVTPAIIIGLIVLFVFVVRMLAPRNAVMAGGGYPGNPGYGPGGMPSYGPGMMGGPVGGGMGGGILGGLATGAAVGAGIVAGEELMHHMTDHDRTETVYDTPRDNSSWNSPPDDMGGTDFGVSDSSSWDSGGGGGGSDDW